MSNFLLLFLPNFISFYLILILFIQFFHSFNFVIIRGASPEHIENLFHSVDVDGSAEINYNEFVAAAMSKYENISKSHFYFINKFIQLLIISYSFIDVLLLMKKDLCLHLKHLI